MALHITNARVITLAGRGRRRGAAMRHTAPMNNADVTVEADRITRVAPSADIRRTDTVIDARGRVVMPGFIDAHTHACWAGDRLDEWVMKLEGAAYLDLLRAGGGIMASVRAVRDATRRQLAEQLGARLDRALMEGTTTIEVKSGYGLDTAAELKMLEAIADAATSWPGTVVPTACIGHALDPDVRRTTFIKRTVEETLDAVHATFPGIAIDAYCENGAWTVKECARLFDKAAELGHPIRVHADQFTELGMLDHAIASGYVSVDHLEATSSEPLARLAESETFGVMLPISGFHVDGRYADGRSFIDAGGALVIATNCNPGSAPSSSIPFAVALAARHLGLTPSEAISAVTANGASLLGLDDRGTVTPGSRADLIMLAHRDERELAHQLGGDPVDLVVCGGVPVRHRT